MDETQQRRHMEFAGEKKPSMLRRKQDHDYASRQMYMITMVTEDRQPLFGIVTGDPRLPYGAAGSPHTELSPLGEALTRQWWGIHGYYPQIEVIAMQVMPDHFHGILFVKERLPRSLGSVLNGFKAGCRKAFRELCPVEYAVAQQRRTGQMRRSFAEKTVDSGGVRRLLNRQSDSRGILFANGYNDRLLLRAGQLQTWLRYLADNPRRLLVKRLHPEFFSVQRAIEWKGMTFSAIGNRFLLRHPMLLQVQCSRRLTKEQVGAMKEQVLAACAKGAVLVSPQISPGEKDIMQAARELGYHEIIIKNNGFVPLAKPAGRYFDACASGQLLFLGPTSHENEFKTITRRQCVSLNEVAHRLCSADGEL